MTAVLGAGLLCVASATTHAAGDATIEVELMVAQISDQKGAIDPRAQKLHKKLSKEVQYGSLKVLEVRRLELAVDEVGRVELPNGKLFQVKPLVFDAKSALLAVDLEGSLQMDMRVKSGQMVVVGPQRYAGGKLVVGLEPSF